MGQNRIRFAISLVFLAACGGSPGRQRAAEGPQCESPCAANSECALMEVCSEAGCCVEAEAREICYEPDGCLSPADVCAQYPGGCACQVVVGHGVGSGGDPRLVLEEGSSLPVEAVLYVRAAQTQVVAATPELALVGLRRGVTLDESTLLGEATAAEGKLQVTYPGAATCYADVTNLGSAPAHGTLEVYVYDQLTGQPLGGAIVVADSDGDGLDDVHAVAGERRTSAKGLAQIATQEGPLTITVFAHGYHYLTVSGVSPQAGRLSLPVAPVRVGGWVAGATGRIDFDAYVKKVRRGKAGSISLGVVAPSLHMESLLQFQLTDLFGGPLVEVDCSTGGEGCYSLEIPGLIHEQVGAWGGMVLNFPTAEVKPHFAVATAPGLRRVWSIAGQWEVTDVDEMLRDIFISDRSACSCNVTDMCEASCSCDTDCRASVQSRMFRAALPFVAQGALGLSGPLDMVATPRSEWESYLNTPYAERPVDSRFPVLDAKVDHAAGPGVAPVQAMSRYTTITVPQLPIDPLTGAPFEGMVAITGMMGTGAGFVPLGVGAGFDCTDGPCPGRARLPEGTGYDGVINSVELCTEGAISMPGGCPGANGEHPVLLPENAIPLVHAAPPENTGLSGHRSMLLALPLDSLGTGSARTAGIVVDGELPEGSVSFASHTFPAFAQAQVSERHLTWSNTADSHLQRLELQGSQGAPGWTVWSLGEGGVVIPAAPSGWQDPWAASDAERTWLTSSLHLRQKVEAAALVGVGATGLPNVGDHVSGFATQHHHGAW